MQVQASQGAPFTPSINYRVADALCSIGKVAIPVILFLGSVDMAEGKNPYEQCVADCTGAGDKVLKCIVKCVPYLIIS